MKKAARNRGLPCAVVLAAGLSAALAAALPASSPDELLAQGNSLYAHGDYAGAADSYQKILGAGFRNSRVYYNLGNARFKQNQIGRAILAYERAIKLDPTDAEARENLRFANRRIRDQIPPDDEGYLLALFGRARDSLTLDQVTTLFVGLYLGSMTLAAGWILGRTRRWGPPAGIGAGVLLGLALLTGGWMSLQARERYASDQAIVLSEKAEVLSGPGVENTLLASVHEGTKVRIHNRRQAWVQVTLPDGRAGWMQGGTLGVI